MLSASRVAGFVFAALDMIEGGADELLEAYEEGFRVRYYLPNERPQRRGEIDDDRIFRYEATYMRMLARSQRAELLRVVPFSIDPPSAEDLKQVPRFRPRTVMNAASFDPPGMVSIVAGGWLLLDACSMLGDMIENDETAAAFDVAAYLATAVFCKLEWNINAIGFGCWNRSPLKTFANRLKRQRRRLNAV